MAFGIISLILFERIFVKSKSFLFQAMNGKIMFDINFSFYTSASLSLVLNKKKVNKDVCVCAVVIFRGFRFVITI